MWPGFPHPTHGLDVARLPTSIADFVSEAIIVRPVPAAITSVVFIFVFTNYRPVYLLLQFSKILEKIFNVRLDKFIEKYNILSSSQYGFRTSTGMSTSMALLELTESITTALDQKCTIGVFIDLKKHWIQLIMIYYSEN